MTKTMRTVNLFAGPGVGKSTTMADVFGMVKRRGKNVEIVTEYAKDAIYQGHGSDFFSKYQTFIFGNQSYRMRTVAEHVDFVITDSPLLMNSAYLDKYPHEEELRALIRSHHNHYESINILLTRNTPYKREGRYQDEHDAKLVDLQIKQMLISENVLFVERVVSDKIAEDVFAIINCEGWLD